MSSSKQDDDSMVIRFLTSCLYILSLCKQINENKHLKDFYLHTCKREFFMILILELFFIIVQ